ncbi:hypothetical protein BAE44_0019967 [Dichanthelium oligosanthes]|uniref:Uncharacterized protein n=1 Tax=Dichanthelium oligosanthes TaxID=888268 RepID=A0A1E5V1H4_9POAL|nr:hypothetical protein BAE44_0019967 [Dichanthelium oligosanthes]
MVGHKQTRPSKLALTQKAVPKTGKQCNLIQSSFNQLDSFYIHAHAHLFVVRQIHQSYSTSQLYKKKENKSLLSLLI